MQGVEPVELLWVEYCQAAFISSTKSDALKLVMEGSVVFLL